MNNPLEVSVTLTPPTLFIGLPSTPSFLSFLAFSLLLLFFFVFETELFPTIEDLNCLVLIFFFSFSLPFRYLLLPVPLLLPKRKPRRTSPTSSCASKTNQHNDLLFIKTYEQNGEERRTFRCQGGGIVPQKTDRQDIDVLFRKRFLVVLLKKK